MKAIRQRIYFWGIFTGLGLASCILIFIRNSLVHENQIRWLFAAAFLTSGLLAGLWVREYKKLKIMELIMENQILHIRPAVINDRTYDRAEFEAVEGIEVFVSNFGILLDKKIIKFNQGGGVRLRAVEIGRNFISLTYGTNKGIQNTWLLTTPIPDPELVSIVKKFRYETGVVPTIVGDKKEGLGD